MQDYELAALLGDTDTTPAQRDAIAAAADRIDARWPDEDLADTRRDALNAAIATVLGDDTLETIAGTYHDARAAEREAHAALTGAVIAAAAIDPTETKTSIAARAGIGRVTLDKALGK